MRSMWGLLPIWLAIMLGYGWCIWYSGTENFAYDVMTYGWPISGVCLGGPAFMFIIMGIGVSIYIESRRR